MNFAVISAIPVAWTARAVEPFESYFPRSVGLIAGVIVVAFVLIALASSGVARALEARRIENLFVRVRYFDPSNRPAAAREAFLMSLSAHRVTLLTRRPLPAGALITVDAPGEKPPANQRFHARVVRCRATLGAGDWYMLRLAVPRTDADEQVVQKELALFRHAPADQVL